MNGQAIMQENSALVCPQCENVNRPGELICSRCKALLGSGLTTMQLDNLDLEKSSPNAAIGKVSFVNWQPVTLEFGVQRAVLPEQEVVSLGRVVSGTENESPCDVDLTPFGAAERGVSRKHLLLRRKNALIYVSDLGSTNGTRLNGQRLLPNTERVLRSGDELQLGSLKATVSF